MHFDVPLSPKAKTSWLAGKQGVVFFTLVVTLAFIGVWSYQLWQGQERALLTAEASAANLARAIEDANNRSLQAVNLILVNVGAGMRPGGWAKDHDGKAFLESLLDEAPQIREVAYADASGRVTDISRKSALPALSIASEDYFKQARTGNMPSLFLSTPQPGRLLGSVTDNPESAYQWHLIAASTVTDDDGVFQGVAFAAINPGYIQEQIGAINIGPGGVVSFYRYDGVMLVQSGLDTLQIGTENHADTPLFADHLAKREWGTFRQAGNAPGDHERIISYRATTRWPVLVAVNLDQHDALAAWHTDALNFSVVMGGGLTVLLILALVVYRQRSAQDRAEKQLTLLGTALKTSANMVLITNVDAQIVWVNDAFCKQFGYDFKDVVGQNPKLLSSGMMTPNVIQNLWQTILNGQIWAGEFINRRKDGSLVIVNQTISPIMDADGRITHFVGIHDDITHRKEVEIELREAKISAEAANHVKTQFLANMSHELRTPLNAVLGFIDMMRLEMFGPLGHDKYREYANDIHQSGSHLLTLISDILDVSKIESGKMELSDDRIVLKNLANSCCKLLDRRAQENGIKLTSHVPDGIPDLLADEVRVKQIILNLLTNAIKFTPMGGSVRLVMELTAQGGVLIRTEDTGVGIAAKDLARVLEPFGQAEETINLSHEGVGLGLYLVKTLTEMHGGRIDVVSTVGVGTHVSVIFPPVRSAPPQAAPVAKVTLN